MLQAASNHNHSAGSFTRGSKCRCAPNFTNLCPPSNGKIFRKKTQNARAHRINDNIAVAIRRARVARLRWLQVSCLTSGPFFYFRANPPFNFNSPRHRAGRSLPDYGSRVAQDAIPERVEPEVSGTGDS